MLLDSFCDFIIARQEEAPTRAGHAAPSLHTITKRKMTALRQAARRTFAAQVDGQYVLFTISRLTRRDDKKGEAPHGDVRALMLHARRRRRRHMPAAGNAASRHDDFMRDDATFLICYADGAGSAATISFTTTRAAQLGESWSTMMNDDGALSHRRESAASILPPSFLLAMHATTKLSVGR